MEATTVILEKHRADNVKHIREGNAKQCQAVIQRKAAHMDETILQLLSKNI